MVIRQLDFFPECSPADCHSREGQVGREDEADRLEDGGRHVGGDDRVRVQEDGEGETGHRASGAAGQD